MKLVKIALTLAAALAVFSCNKPEPFKGEATVGFASDTTKLSFANTYAQIPVVLEGHSNVWPLQINVEVVTDYDGDGFPAKENEDFLLTAYYLNIGKPSGYEDSIANNNKVVVEDGLEVTFPKAETAVEYRFKLKITSATEGVKIGKAETVVVAAIDDLQRLAGTFTITGDLYTKDGDTFTKTGSNADEAKVTASGNNLTYTGLLGTTGKLVMERTEGRNLNLLLGFANSFNKNEKEPDPENPDETVTVKYYYGVCVVDAEGNIISDGKEAVEGVFYSDFASINFGTDVTDNYVALAKYNAEGEFVGFYENKFIKNFKFVKK